MGFRYPINAFDDETARAAAASAAAAAAAAQSTANSATTAASTAQTAANNAITLANNPVAQIPAGALPGSKLAADAIDGKTITGALIRTAASGQRVQLDTANGLVGYNAAGQANTQVRTSDGVLIASGAQITGTLDTRPTPTSAGVIVSGSRTTYQDGTGGSGYLEATSPGGGTIVGSEYSMVGNGGGGTDPAVRVGPYALPGGGYAGQVQLVGDKITQQVATDPLVAITALSVTSAFFTPYLAGYRSPSYCKLASGQVVVFGSIKVTSVSFGAGQLVATLPVGCRPLATERFILHGWGQTWTVDVGADGTIKYVSAGSGASVVVNSLLSLAGIAFPAEQ